MSNAQQQADRPLSPHLQVYRPMLSMTMSIVHRMTGAALYFGTLLLAWWLLALASGPAPFAVAQEFMGSFLGRLILFAYTWALVHHMLGGLKHLVWDTGRGFDLSAVEWMARGSLVVSVLLTFVIWFIGYSVL